MGFLDKLLGRSTQEADKAVDEVNEMAGRGENEAAEQAEGTAEAADAAADAADEAADTPS